MNWVAISTIAEVVGALGVIISLVYLAIQIRQGNKNHEVSSLQQLSRDFGDHGAVVMSDENVGAYIKGLNAYEDLTPEERLKFDLCVGVFINSVENSLYHAGAGHLDEVLDMLAAYLGPRIFAYPGFETWWNHGKKAGFADVTRNWVDRQIEIYRSSPRFWEYEMKDASRGNQ